MKKEIIPFVVIALTIVFLIISLLVYITKGENSYFLKKKLRIGAILLSLTFVANGCGITDTNCYAPQPLDKKNIIIPDSLLSGSINLNLKITNIIAGTISERKDSIFSYSISDTTLVIKQKGNIAASDGAFDETKEEFKITVNPLPAGKYFLNFFTLDKDSINKGYSIALFILHIEN